MKKRIFGRQFSRDTNERKALLNGLMNALVLRESIVTTEAKAKAMKGHVEKLITKAKKKGKAAEGLLMPHLSPEAVRKTIDDLAVRFAKRPGGYTRIIRADNRFSDNAKMVIVEWVEKKKMDLAEESVKKPQSIQKVEATIAKGKTASAKGRSSSGRKAKATNTKTKKSAKGRSASSEKK